MTHLVPAEKVCPHCEHEWYLHKRPGSHESRCSQCFCQWMKPEPLKSVPEPTPHELLVARIKTAIYTELDRQHEHGEIQGAGYWDSEYGCCDGEPNWDLIAEAITKATNLDTPDC